MRKRKINPQYLRRITSQDVKDESIDTLEFADSLKRFADEYLGHFGLLLGGGGEDDAALGGLLSLHHLDDDAVSQRFQIHNGFLLIS